MFDRLDRKILSKLDENSRSPFSSISKSINLGSNLVEYRIKNMVAEKIISNFYTQVDFSKIGLTVYKTYLRLNFNKEQIKKLIEYLNNKNYLYWMSEWYGSWDLLYSTCTKSPREFNKYHKEIFSKFYKSIVDYEVITLNRVVRYSKGYLLNKNGISHSYGDSLETIAIDEVELSILKILSNNSRASLVSISQKVNLSTSAVKYRIKKLVRLKIIVGYRIQFEYVNLNILVVKLLLMPIQFNPSLGDKLEDFCRRTPEITCFIEQQRKFSYEIEAELSGYEQLHNLVDKLKDKFENKIKVVNTLFLRKDHKHRMLYSNLQDK